MTSGKHARWGISQPQIDSGAPSSWMADAGERAVEGKRLQEKDRGGVRAAWREMAALAIPFVREINRLEVVECRLLAVTDALVQRTRDAVQALVQLLAGARLIIVRE